MHRDRQRPHGHWSAPPVRGSWPWLLARVLLVSLLTVLCPRAALGAVSAPQVAVEPLLGAVAPGDTIAYKVTVRNAHGERIDQTTVHLWTTSALLSASSAAQAARPSGPPIAPIHESTVTFGPIDAQGERSAIALFAVAPEAPDNALLTLQARSDWQALHTGGMQPVRVTPVRVVAPGHDAAVITPRVGTPATTFLVHGDHFLPGETVVAILLSADGTVVLLPQAMADPGGSVVLAFRNASSATGVLTVVLHGALGGFIQRTRVTLLPG